MATVGVAMVNGVGRSGYLFAPGFVGDGSQLTGVHTSNVTCSKPGQLAYYIDPTTIGGDPTEVIINGNLYVTGTLYSSNTLEYENHILSVGTFDSSVHTKGVLISNVMLGLTDDVLTFGFTNGTARDIQLFPDPEKSLRVNVLGPLSAKTFLGDASNLSNIVDSPDGVYGSELTVPKITVSNSGRLSVSAVPIQSTLESVTTTGSSTSKSIQFENGDLSFSTLGKVGISNTNPTSLLCVGDGVRISNRDISIEGTLTSSSIVCDGSKILKTSDAAPGTYGDGLTVPVVTVNSKGRLSSLETLKITTSLENVTEHGSSSKQTIRLTNPETSLVTHGSVGVATAPRKLLSVGNSTDFDGDNLTMDGNVSAKNFFGNAHDLTNTSDVKPGIYGGGAIVPQIWVNEKGRISDIQLTNIFMTLDQMMQFNNSTGATLRLKNTNVGLISDGDINVTQGKDVVWLDEFHNTVCTLGQKSEKDSRTIQFSGTQQDSIMNMSNWHQVFINEGLSVNSEGFTTMRGCFMEPGTGLVLNAQQLSKSNDDLILTRNDLFKWFSLSPTTNKKVLLPDPSKCQAGSWIGLTNLSCSCVTVFDITGTVVFSKLESSEFAAGVSNRFMCVSPYASANGVITGGMWVLA